jgi:hypothetical protein
LDLHESGIIEKPFKKTSTAICFQFFIFDLEFLKQFKSSDPLHAKRPLILLLVRFTVCIECCLPVGWRTFILFWFGLRNDESFYLRAAIQRTIDASPAFMEYGLAKKIAA